MSRAALTVLITTPLWLAACAGSSAALKSSPSVELNAQDGGSFFGKASTTDAGAAGDAALAEVGTSPSGSSVGPTLGPRFFVEPNALDGGSLLDATEIIGAGAAVAAGSRSDSTNSGPDFLTPALRPTDLPEANACQGGVAANQAYCQLRCWYKEVICLTTEGSPIPSEVFPESLDPKTTYYLYLLGKPGSPKPNVRITETVGTTPTDRVNIKGRNLRYVLSTGTDTVVAVITQTMAEDAVTEHIVFSDEDDKATASLIIRSNGGLKFYAFGPAIVIPFEGAPTINEVAPPSGSGLRYERSTPATPSTAFMVHVYPFGHRAQVLSPFRPWGKLQTLSDLLSIEVGLNLNPTKLLDRLMLGAAIEPVTGFTASFGVSFDRADRFANGYAAGAFVAERREDGVEHYIHVAPYLGFGLTQNIFSTLSGAFASSAGQQGSQ